MALSRSRRAAASTRGATPRRRRARRAAVRGLRADRGRGRAPSVASGRAGRRCSASRRRRAPPISCTGVDQRVELDRAAGIGVLQHRGAEAAELARQRRCRSSPDCAIGQPMRAPIAAASAMQRSMKPRTSGSSRIASVGRAGERRDRVHRHVAPELVPDVAAHVGARLGLEAGARRAPRRPPRRAPKCRRAARRRSAARRSRGARAPGAGRRAGEVDDAAEHALERQPREQRAAGIDARERRLVRHAPAGRNHHGTPFIAGRSDRRRRRAAARSTAATAASAGALTAMTTSSCGPSAAASSLDARAAR